MRDKRNKTHQDIPLLENDQLLGRNSNLTASCNWYRTSWSGSCVTKNIGTPAFSTSLFADIGESRARSLRSDLDTESLFIQQGLRFSQVSSLGSRCGWGQETVTVVSEAWVCEGKRDTILFGLVVYFFFFSLSFSLFSGLVVESLIKSFMTWSNL